MASVGGRWDQRARDEPCPAPVSRKSPERRFQSARDLALVLQRAGRRRSEPRSVQASCRRGCRRLVSPSRRCCSASHSERGSSGRLGRETWRTRPQPRDSRSRFQPTCLLRTHRRWRRRRMVRSSRSRCRRPRGISCFSVDWIVTSWFRSRAPTARSIRSSRRMANGLASGRRTRCGRFPSVAASLSLSPTHPMRRFGAPTGANGPSCSRRRRSVRSRRLTSRAAQ